MPFELEGIHKWIFVRIPNLIGGTLFVAGGFCEVFHNRDRSPAYIEWWAAWTDFVGCIAFFIGVVCGLIPATGQAGQMGYAVGISCFVASGILFITMWRSNDFGFTLLRQLNDALRAGGHVSLTKVDSGNVAIRHGTQVDAVS